MLGVSELTNRHHPSPIAQKLKKMDIFSNFGLTLFVIVPALMLLGLWIARDIKQVRGVMVAGSSVLVALSVLLTVQFINLRAAGNTDEMLFVSSMPWFKSLNISYAIGVDGISVVMLLLSSIIVFTGTFASWKLQPLTKEFFMWFVLLSTGVFGFFICIDLFAMFIEDTEVSMEAIGEALVGSEKYQYVLPFEFISLFLLACIIGGLVVSRNQKEDK